MNAFGERHSLFCIIKGLLRIAINVIVENLIVDN